MKFYFRYSFILLIILIAASCRKDKFLTDSSVKLSFSADTLMFDTVFTSIGSAVRSFKIYNTENKRVKISSLRIAGGENSFFRLNVDGVPGKIFTDVEVGANDSIYVFAAVTIDPTGGNNPFIVEDSVMFEINGNTQHVILDAYGQNAYFHYGVTLKTSDTWLNDKPHVVINSFLVDSNATLTIPDGTRIYMHGNSAFFVNGTLIAQGTKEDSIVFQGDRLEAYFLDLPGNWGYLRFLRPSKNNLLEHVIIKDALIGVVVDSLSVNANFKLTMRKCIIKNMFYYGIQSATGSIKAENCLIYNCGENDALLYLGGDYQFDFCTFGGYSNVALTHQKPVVTIANYYERAQNDFLVGELAANFTNCIIYGSLDDELLLDSLPGANVPFNYKFTNCNIKSAYTFNAPNYINCQKNNDPLFTDPSTDKYDLADGTPCKDAGTSSAIQDDINDKLRDTLPDIGCYEK